MEKEINQVYAEDTVNLRTGKVILNLFSVSRNNITNSNTLSPNNFSRD